jgi:hypothetical protein
MTDVENTFRLELERMLVVDTTPDWEGVLASTRDGGEDARGRRLGIAAAVLLAAVAVALVSPLGGAIARGLEDFTTWLTGEPGTPVSAEEQRAFDEENKRTWLGFPEGTELRRLVTQRVGDTTVELLGFRSGSQLCVRLNVTGALTKKALECAPLAELRREGGPARVLIADEGIGRGDKDTWYGVDLVHSSKVRISAGIAADGVRAIVLGDGVRRHEVPVESNAFLHVVQDPEVGQIVTEVWARTAAGLVAVPFAPATYGFASTPSAAPPPAPAVEREVVGGTVGWLDAREERGEPLDALPEPVLRDLRRHLDTTVFARVLTPDPGRPQRVVITLNAHRPGGDPAGLCTWTLSRRSSSGGCTPYPAVFERGPFTYGTSGGGTGAFLGVNGLASDDVARLEAVLADGQKVDVPLSDNVHAIDLPRAKLPALLVAYDSEDRVISVSDPVQDMLAFAQPARGKAELLWRVEGPGGASAELLVGPSTHGDVCEFVRRVVDGERSGTGYRCTWLPWERSPVQVHPWQVPATFVGGRVRDDVTSVRIRFADGATTVVQPRRGYILYAVPADRLAEPRQATAAEGLNAAGRVVGTMPFPRPRGG